MRDYGRQNNLSVAVQPGSESVLHYNGSPFPVKRTSRTKMVHSAVWLPQYRAVRRAGVREVVNYERP